MQNELSASMILDDNLLINEEDNIKGIETRQRKIWIDESKICDCSNCKITFTFYNRVHHCRSCGNVFCHKCSDFWLDKLPNNIPLIPNTWKNKINLLSYMESELRVCESCYTKINNLKRLLPILKVFDNIELTIKEYNKMKLINEDWKIIGNYYLSKLREIQYKLPFEEYTNLEKFLLKNNKKLLKGHSIWNIHLFKLDKIKIEELEDKKECDCKFLMCSRLCRENFSEYEILSLLNNIKNKDKLIFILKYIKEKLNEEKKKIYIGFIIQQIHQLENNLDEIICNFLIDIAKESFILSSEIFWNIKILSESNNLKIKKKNLLESTKNIILNDANPLIKKSLNDSIKINLFFNNINKNTPKKDLIKFLIKNEKIFSNVYLPFFPHLLCIKILIDKLEVKDSSSSPLLLTFKLYDEKKDKFYEKRLLYKFEDVRQDYIVINTIKIMNMIIKKELHLYTNNNKYDFDIITYNVFPISLSSGIIEILPNSHTLLDISKKFSIFNFIIEKNPLFTVDVLRSRFLYSSAVYSIITFLLGVGDRHLDNIMINDYGHLFHIDYGYIIGTDPKPINYTSMRITSDMVDALGGENSIYYLNFVKLVKDIHLCLHKRFPIIYIFIKQLIHNEPKINSITINTLIDQLSNRFMYGENYEEAGNQLTIEIYKSKHSINQTLIDFVHYHNKEKTLFDFFNYLNFFSS